MRLYFYTIPPYNQSLFTIFKEYNRETLLLIVYPNKNKI